MSGCTTPMLPLSGDAMDARVDHDRLRDSQRMALTTERRLMRGKVREVFDEIRRAGRVGLTMREMAAISGRGINCWTQPFATLRSWGVIATTDCRRGGGVVHVLRQTIRVFEDGTWEVVTDGMV